MIFNGRSRRDDAELALQFHCGFCPFGCMIFNGLGFIENNRRKFYPPQYFGFALHQIVGTNQDIERLKIFDHFGTVAISKNNRIQRRCKPSGFAFPISTNRNGRKHQRRTFFGSRGQHCKGLHGFSKSHIVRKARPDAPIRQAHEPLIAFKLVRTQFSVES